MSEAGFGTIHWRREVLTRIDTNKHEFLIAADDPNPVGVTY
jgi:hypothetical protein